MVNEVGYFSSKGLNPYLQGWNNGGKQPVTKINSGAVAIATPQQTAVVQQAPQNDTFVSAQGNNKKLSNDKLTKAAFITTGAAAVVAAGAAIVSRKNVKKLSQTIKNLPDNSDKLRQIEEKLSAVISQTANPTVVVNRQSNKALIAALAAALGVTAGTVSGKVFADETKKALYDDGIDDSDIKTLENAASGARDAITRASNQALTALDKANSRSSSTDGATKSMGMHRKEYYGLNLLIFADGEKVINKNANDFAIKQIRNAGDFYMNRTADEAKKDIRAYREMYGNILSKNTVWSVTAEFDPIKSGGLGVVPVELQDNFTALGLDNPTFVPMYLEAGKAELKADLTNGANNYIYNYNNKPPFSVTKFASMPVTKYNGTVPSTQNIEFYLGYGAKDKDKTKPIVFVKDSETFSTDLYRNGMQGHEKMKFALLDKAVYQLAKQKMSDAFNQNKNTGVSELIIHDKSAYDKIKPPISMILNDWHAAPLAGMMRYKSLMEAAYNEIDGSVASAMNKLPLVMIGHNAGISGSTAGDDLLTENVINTLFDRYAFGIACNANSGYYELTDNEAQDDISINKTDIGSSIFFNRFRGNREFNSLAHGIALADWYVPVSKNYSEELRANVQDSGTAFGLLEKRARAGARKSSNETLKNSTVLGIVNGLDKTTNSIKNKVNVPGIKYYDENSSLQEIMEARNNNKMVLGNVFILDKILSKDKSDLKNTKDDKTLSEVQKNQKIAGLEAKIAEKTEKFNKEFNDETPVLAFAHRLTEQKGLDILSGAVIRLYNDWDKLFPDKPRPFFLVGGPLDDASQLKYIENLSNESNFSPSAKDDMWKIITNPSNMPNPLIYSGTTYFCGPSTFEPCGLIQGEAFAMGTPVITTHTGGYVDTVIDNSDPKAKAEGKLPNGFVSDYRSKSNVIKNDKPPQDIKDADRNEFFYKRWLEVNTNKYYEKMVEALKFYYDDKTTGEYSKMVENNLKNVNFSWSQGRPDDSIHQYLDKLGISDADLAEMKK